MRASEYAFFDAPFLAFAHRGGAHSPGNVGRGNTVHAFRTAIDLGYRYLETDVHATADGVLVAFHDDRLDRVTRDHGLIGELTFAQLRRVRTPAGDPVPTFAELLTAFPEARFNVDAKSEASVELLAQTIVEHRAHDRVCVSSFGASRLRRLRRLLPQVASAATSRGVAVNRFTPWLTRLLNSPAPALQLPIRYPLPNRFGLAGRQIRTLTPQLIKAAHRAGKQVHIWTVDEPEVMNWLIDAGVDGIFTDRIDTLKDVLTCRDLWPAG